MTAALCTGAADVRPITGRKGGSKKPKAPVEAPDSVRSTATAKILIAVGEGEFDGVPTARDIYLDNTPLQNASGGMNFEGVKWDWRPGSVDQDHIPGIPAVENETTVNVELRSDAAFVRSFSNTQLSAVRLRFAWPALQEQLSNGDVVGYRIEYAVEVSTDGGAYVEVLREVLDDKTTTRYERSRRIDLPPSTSGWLVRVVRLTPNQNNNRVADTMIIASYTEVIDAKLRYPNTALLYVEFNAEQFQNIPAVTVETDARRVPVPSNYDPRTRTYTGIWDGTMKQAWTDNPVWITYDVVTNDRFGLGKRIKPWMVDRWEMYRIAQYCDQLVPDGKGGQEPRHLCNLNLQSRVRAWDLLRDLSAIYRGMTYWAQGQLKVQADIPRATDFDFAFTRANVVDGHFGYKGASERTHYSRALVSYDNPINNYDTDVTPVTDKRLQLRFGDNLVELSPIGGTRQSEAQRQGKWVLLTNNQDRLVNFRVGMDGAIPLPGFVVPVADSVLAGREIGGRISAVAGRTITLDRDTQAKPGDRLIVNLPSGKAEGRTVQSVAGRAVTVSTAYSEVPERELVWALDADDLAVPLYRVMRVGRPEKGVFEISALQYEPGKFAAVDNGAKLETRPISVIPTGEIEAPASVSLTTFSSVDQGIAVTTMTIAWPAVSGAVAYDVEWKRDNGNWIRIPRTGGLGVDVRGIYAGQYLARVRAISAFEIASTWRSSALTELQGKTEPPPVLAYLNTTPIVFGIRLDWGFPAGATDALLTEIRYGTTNDFDLSQSFGTHAYPTATALLQGLAAARQLFFWGRLVDKSGNVGEWLGPVLGTSSADADEILDYLTGEITETQLGEYLAGEVDKISGDGPGSVNRRINDAIAEVADALAYDPESAYAEGDTVRGGPNGRRLYQALVAVPAAPDGSNAPPNPALWMDIGQVVEDANGVVTELNQTKARVETVEGKVSAQGESINVLRAETRPKRADGEKADALRGWQTQASYAQLVRVQATDNEASVTRDTQLSASVGDVGARLTIEEQVRATADSALAQRSERIEARLPAGEGALATSASVETVAQAQVDQTGKLNAMWGVKLEAGQGGQYEVAGIGLGIENVGGLLQSQFLVRANRFAILNNSGGGVVSPFAVQGGQVFMNSAVIRQADIVNLIVTGELRSGDYIAGQRGIRINFVTNEFELNGSTPGQGRTLVNNEGGKVFDSNGVVRFQYGKLGA